MDRVLVTGAAGFIGSHLVESVLDSGASVLAFDNFSLGKRHHLQRAMASGRLELADGDVRSAEDLRAAAQFTPDAVFHLAALHFIPYCDAHPRLALDVNVLGLDAVIHALRAAPLKSFVFASSGAIYGFGDKRWPETAEPRPADIYSISKWMGEQVMTRFHTGRPEVRTVVARLFNTYGPRETNPHVLPGIIQALDEGKPVELGNLWPRRDLIFVTDTAAGLIASAAGERGFNVFNVGTGIGTAIIDVLEVIEEITGSRLEARQVPARMREDDGHLVSDPRKLMSTGWRPRCDLRAGLRRLLASEGLL